MRLSGITALLLAGALITSPAIASKVYKWVDENGVTNFGEHPPKNATAQVIKPNTGHSEPVNYDTPAPEQPAEQAQVQEQPQASLKNPERCEIAQRNLKTLQNFGRVRVPNEDGSFHYLTEEEQQERLKETQQAVDESC